MKVINLLASLLLVAAGQAFAGDSDVKTAIGGGLGAVAGTAIGEAVGGKTGSIVGGAVGGGVGAAATTKGEGKTGAIVGGAAGGAAGAAVGRSAGGKTGALVGAGVGGAAGATVGKAVTESDNGRVSGRRVRHHRDGRDDGEYDYREEDDHGRGHAYGHRKHGHHEHDN